MKILFKKSHFLVVWPWFVRTSGRITSGASTAKGAAIFPFIFVLQEENPPWLINHELIHFRQAIETLFIGVFVLSLIERLYARYVLKMNKMERYLYAATEQEAYLNHADPEYLEHRRFGSLFSYVRHKRTFTLVGPGQVEFLEK